MTIRIHTSINIRISQWLVEGLLLVLFRRFITILFFFVVAFIEESEIVWILLFAILSRNSCFFWYFVVLLLLFVLWSYLMITHAFITYVPIHVAWSLVLAIADADVVWVIVSWKPRSIFMVAFLVADCCSCWSGSSLACCVTCSTLIVVVAGRLFLNIFSLANLRACNLHSFSLLDEKHVSMITRCLYYFWSCTSTFNIHSESLIELKILWTGRIINMIHLVIGIILAILLSIWCSICSSKSSESRWIHLFL